MRSGLAVLQRAVEQDVELVGAGCEAVGGGVEVGYVPRLAVAEQALFAGAADRAVLAVQHAIAFLHELAELLCQRKRLISQALICYG